MDLASRFRSSRSSSQMLFCMLTAFLSGHAVSSHTCRCSFRVFGSLCASVWACVSLGCCSHSVSFFLLERVCCMLVFGMFSEPPWPLWSLSECLFHYVVSLACSHVFPFVSISEGSHVAPFASPVREGCCECNTQRVPAPWTWMSGGGLIFTPEQAPEERSRSRSQAHTEEKRALKSLVWKSGSPGSGGP